MGGGDILEHGGKSMRTDGLSEAILRSLAYGGPRWLALLSGGQEISGCGYKRQPITFTGIPAPVCNVNPIAFWCCAEVGWGKAEQFGIADSASGGNILAIDELRPARAIAFGDWYVIAPGALEISVWMSGQ
jgi:hypothetical protein